MKHLGSLIVPILMLSAWFIIAIATLVRLTHMSVALTEMEQAEEARKARLQAPRLASAKPPASAQ